MPCLQITCHAHSIYCTACTHTTRHTNHFVECGMVVDVELRQERIRYLCHLSDSIFILRLNLPAGAQDLRAPDDRMYRPLHPSIVETLPDDFPDLKHEFSKLESQMFDRSIHV